jgi:hypothetical protein
MKNDKLNMYQNYMHTLLLFRLVDRLAFNVDEYMFYIAVSTGPLIFAIWKRSIL